MRKHFFLLQHSTVRALKYIVLQYLHYIRLIYCYLTTSQQEAEDRCSVSSAQSKYSEFTSSDESIF